MRGSGCVRRPQGCMGTGCAASSSTAVPASRLCVREACVCTQKAHAIRTNPTLQRQAVQTCGHPEMSEQVAPARHGLPPASAARVRPSSNRSRGNRLATGLGPRWRQRPAAVGTPGRRGPATQQGARRSSRSSKQMLGFNVPSACYPGVLPSPPVLCASPCGVLRSGLRQSGGCCLTAWPRVGAGSQLSPLRSRARGRSTLTLPELALVNA